MANSKLDIVRNDLEIGLPRDVGAESFIKFSTSLRKHMTLPAKNARKITKAARHSALKEHERSRAESSETGMDEKKEYELSADCERHGEIASA